MLHSSTSFGKCVREYFYADTSLNSIKITVVYWDANTLNYDNLSRNLHRVLFIRNIFFYNNGYTIIIFLS